MGFECDVRPLLVPNLPYTPIFNQSGKYYIKNIRLSGLRSTHSTVSKTQTRDELPLLKKDPPSSIVFKRRNQYTTCYWCIMVQ